MNDFFSVTNVASPLSPLNPLNPLNPASPLNPINMQPSEPAAPVDKFTLRNEQFQEDLKQVAGTSDWAAARAGERPGVGSLRETADGFALRIVRDGFFGPTRDVEYLLDRSKQTVEVTEQSLTGPVRDFFSGREPHEHYILNLDKGTCKEV